MRIPRSGCWALFNFADRGEVLLQCNTKAESIFLRFRNEMPNRDYFPDIPKPKRVRGWLRIGWAGRTWTWLTLTDNELTAACHRLQGILRAAASAPDS